MDDLSVARGVERIRGGTALEYGYDAYGAGRVAFVVSFDPVTGTFREARTDHETDGTSHTSQTTITDEAVARHVRAAAAG